MDNISIAKEWFRYAEQDLQAVKALNKTHPKLLEIICYHCQQSAEKYLKGFIGFTNKETIRKIHDLPLLNETCMKYDASFEKIKEQCLKLTDYGVQSRYPFEMEITEFDAILAIENAEQIQTFVTELFQEKLHEKSKKLGR